MSFSKWYRGLHQTGKKGVVRNKWPNKAEYEGEGDSICEICLSDSLRGPDFEGIPCCFGGAVPVQYVREAFCYFHEEKFGSPHPYYDLWSSEWGGAATTGISVDEAWVESVALSTLEAHANDLDSIARKLRGYPSDPFCYYRYTFAERGIEAELANMAASSDIGRRHAVEKLHPVLIRMKEILVERGYTWL